MAIKVGDRFPSLTVTTVTPEGPKDVSTDAILKGKKVVLFAVPGAFTPTCSQKHLPGFVHQAAALKAKGVDTIVCLAVNDPFVLAAWAKDQHADGSIVMLADGSGVLTKALGMELDLTARGLGVRSQRYAMILDDGRVTHLATEPPGTCGITGAQSILAHL